MSETPSTSKTNDTQGSANKNDNQGGKKESKISPEAEYGYYYYPERKEKYQWSFWKNFNIFDRYSRTHNKCLMNLHQSLENPQIKILLQALKAHGCETVRNRHVICEECIYPVQGGFDPKVNQVIVCQNMCKSQKRVASVMGHELTHMFDYCRANLDYKNLEHLACTEIRAANFFHCGFMGAWMQGDCTMWAYDKGHQKCVKRKAVESIMAVRTISQEEAYAVVDKVFVKCYNDLEPFGRRVRTTNDAKLALAESRLHGHKINVTSAPKRQTQPVAKS